MTVHRLLVAPPPVLVDLRSPKPPEQAGKVLEKAIQTTDFVDVDRNSPGFYRIRGEVFRGFVTLTARPYFMPGIRAGSGAMSLALAGEIKADGSGSRLQGSINAPFDPLLIVAGIGVNAVVVLFLLAVDQSTGAIVFAVALTVLLQGGWAFVRRHNQRMALRHVNEVLRFLRTAFPDDPHGA